MRIKKQQDQDAADRAAEAQKNAPVDNTQRPSAPGPFGPLAGATANVINPSLQDHTGRQFLQSPQPDLPQLDNSNLAGPVPTTLTPPPQLPVANTRPRLATGTPIEQGGAPPIGYNGGQLLSSGDFNYMNPRTPNPKSTYEGTPMPQRPDYRSGVDANGQPIGRMARFGAGFREGLRGGPVFGLGNAIASLLAPGHGNEEKYQVDSERFNREKAIDQSRDRNDPYYQNQLQTQQERMDQPIKLKTYAEEQGLLQQNRLNFDAQRSNERAALAKSNNDAKVALLQQKDKDYVNRRTDALTIQYRGPGVSEQEAKELARDQALKETQAGLNKTTAQTNNFNAGVELKTKQGAALGSRIKIAQGNLDERIRANDIREAELERAGGNDADRQQVANTKVQLEGLRGDLSSLEKQAAEYDSILRDDFAAPDKKELAKNQLVGLHKRMDEVTTQMRGVSGAPKQGEVGAPPARKTPAGRTSGSGLTPGLTKEQDNDYKVRKAKHPEMTPEDYLKALKLAGK